MFVMSIDEKLAVIHDEFREGNIAPASKNLEFIQTCEACLPKGHHIAHVRLDSAEYQSDIFNYCEETSKIFAIGGRLDASTFKALEAIPESDWQFVGQVKKVYIFLYPF